MKKWLLAILLFATFYIVGSASAASQFRTISGGEIYSGDLAILGENLTVEGDATINGDVAVLGGSAEMNGIVNGDIAVFGGSLTVLGTVNGDIAVFGGSAQIDGHVAGDIVAMGGAIHLNEMAYVEGDCQTIGGILDGIATCHQTRDREVSENGDGELPQHENDPLLPPHPREIENRHNNRPTILNTLITSVLIAGIAYLVAKFAPQQLFRVADTAKAHPLRSGGLGLLTSLGVILLTFILIALSTMLLIICIGIFGFPIAIALILTYGLAILMGLFAQGQLVAEQLAVRYDGWKRYNYAQQVALGTGIISFGLGMLSFVPLVGGAINALLFFIIINIAIGSVVLTRFGTRNPRDYEPVLDPNKIQEAIDNMPS